MNVHRGGTPSWPDPRNLPLKILGQPSTAELSYRPWSLFERGRHDVAVKKMRPDDKLEPGFDTIEAAL